MAYTLTFDRKPEYLHVKVTGENSPESVTGYLSEVHRACSGAECPGLLIEEDLQGPSIAVSDVFAIVSEGSRSMPPGIRKIAFVDLNSGHDFARMQFAETVAVNRGINMRLCRSLEEAQKWLLAEGAGP
jgi:hypothetical protein